MNNNRPNNPNPTDPGNVNSPAGVATNEPVTPLHATPSPAPTGTEQANLPTVPSSASSPTPSPTQPQASSSPPDGGESTPSPEPPLTESRLLEILQGLNNTAQDPPANPPPSTPRPTINVPTFQLPEGVEPETDLEQALVSHNTQLADFIRDQLTSITESLSGVTQITEDTQLDRMLAETVAQYPTVTQQEILNFYQQNPEVQDIGKIAEFLSAQKEIATLKAELESARTNGRATNTARVASTAANGSEGDGRNVNLNTRSIAELNRLAASFNLFDE